MGLFSFLFKKKNKTAEVAKTAPESDGQEKYLLEKEPEPEAPAPTPVVEEAPAPEKKAAPKKKAAAKPTAEKAEAKADEAKPAEKKPAPVKKAAPAKKAEPVKNEEPTPEDDSLTEESAEEGEVLESKATRSGKFELKRAKDGRFFFNLYASNHTVIAFSQIYSSANSALTGIKSVMANAGVAGTEDTTLKNPTTASFPKWEIYIDKANQYRFRLYAANGNCVCHSSHGYTTKAGCKGGIDSIIRFAAESRIDKKYLVK